ncbi:hypothetical protein DFJ58DRAFT_650243, partial [Suillus subalutaceus]|uniref:uncharacterized protein n=1 Tax=Suillus subalutaceus TaxID=48586 RepID=UPI001B87006E
FFNTTMFYLICWFYSGSVTKSLADLDHLVNEDILAKDFDKGDLKEFWALKESNHLDDYQGNAQNVQSPFSALDSWKETSIKIHIPADGVQYASEDVALLFKVPGLFY